MIAAIIKCPLPRSAIKLDLSVKRTSSMTGTMREKPSIVTRSKITRKLSTQT